jgi:hypothetical protein
MPKCSHDLCLNESESGSVYCKDCIQLPTRECNYCNLAEMTENRALAEYITANAQSKRRFFFVIAGIAIALLVLFVIVSWLNLKWW